MASRYWRGGTGTWNTTNTNNWAASANACKFTASRATTVLTVTAVTSGAIEVGMTVWHTTSTAIGTITAFGTGTGGVGTYTMSASGTVTSRAMSSATIGASVPTSSDPLVFDADSNVGTAAFTVTVGSSSCVCGGFSASDLSTTMTLGGSLAMTVAGDFLLPASNFTRTYSGTITFTGTGAITTNGVSLANTLIFNGTGQTFTLGSALTTSSGVTLTTGNLSLQSFTLATLSFTSNNTNTRSINFGTGKISVTGTTGTVWNMPDLTGFTLSGTPVLERVNAGGTVWHGQTGGSDYSKAISVQSTGSVGGTYAGRFRDFQAGGSIVLTTVVTVFGNLTINSGATQSGISFSLTAGSDGLTPNTVTTNGVTLTGISNPTANIVLGSNLTLSGTAQLKIDTADFDFTCTSCTLNAGSQLRSSTIRLRSISVFPGIDPGTSTIILYEHSANALLTVLGDRTTTTQLYNVLVSCGVEDRTTAISGNLSFNRFYNESAVPHTVTFYLDSESDGWYYSFVNFDASGTGTAQLTIKSDLTGIGSTATLTQASGTVNLNYVTIENLTASGGATWNAFTSNGNIDGGGNTGWIFSGGSSDSSASISVTASVSAAANIIQQANASVFCSATVTAQATRIQFGVCDVLAQAAVSASATRILFGNALVNANATVLAAGEVVSNVDASASVVASCTVTASAIRVRDANAVVNGTATLSANGVVWVGGSASVQCDAQVLASALAIYVGMASISNTATVSAAAMNGDSWSPDAESNNTWEDVAASSNSWSQVSNGNNTWLQQN